MPTDAVAARPGRSSAAALITISRHLAAEAEALEFAPPVAFVYNPLVYAASMHEAYLTRYGRGRKRILFLGMNPGPFGMAQTGVPFGDVETVAGWMGLAGTVGRPPRIHRKRPVEGLECPRVEVSGQRLWGWIRERWSTPQSFFAEAFVANYCPLVFLEASGRNRTPDRLPAREREALFAVCDRALRRVIDVVEPEWVVGIGAFAHARAAAATGGGRGSKVARILHPSPASPAANRGWRQRAERELAEQNIELRGMSK